MAENDDIPEGEVIEPALHDFFVTFGMQYPREANPAWAYADHDGWVHIAAPDEPTARAIAIDKLQLRWSMLYAGHEWSSEYFPAGELATASWTGDDREEDGAVVPGYDWDESPAVARFDEAAARMLAINSGDVSGMLRNTEYRVSRGLEYDHGLTHRLLLRAAELQAAEQDGALPTVDEVMASEEDTSQGRDAAGNP